MFSHITRVIADLQVCAAAAHSEDSGSASANKVVSHVRARDAAREGTRRRGAEQALDNPWYQQKVPAYQPLLTPIKIAWILFGTGIVFIIIGLSVRSVNTNDIFTRKVQYDGDGTPSANKNAARKRADTNTVCTVEIGNQTKMEEPVYVWYEIDNFYQNHNRYMTRDLVWSNY